MTEKGESYVRFSVAQRVEHIVLILSFSTLAITGLAQKYAESSISIAIIMLLGGIDATRIIHRAASVVFVVESIYHLAVIGYKLYVQRKSASMLPRFRDLRDAFHQFLYNIGFRKEYPKMGRYNFIEKAEYWAMVWGLALMAITGFMMWNPIATASILPGQVIPAAKAAHGAEAVLAVLAIFLWHFYHVHVKAFNKSMFTGKLTRHEMEKEHGEELEQIENGLIPQPPPPHEQKRRHTIYVPVATVTSVIVLLGLYYFLTFEQTAITTIQPVSARSESVFVPQTPTPLPTAEPTPTLAPTEAGGLPQGALTWNNGIGDMFALHCGLCHGEMGGLALDSYSGLMAGGRSGSAVVAGNPDESLIVTLIKDADHPGGFEPEEWIVIIQWIAEGAVE